MASHYDKYAYKDYEKLLKQNEEQTKLLKENAQS